MANRKDFHYRQKVTEAELDGAFDALEVADRNFAIDHELTGLVSGLVVTQHGPANLTVDVSAGTGYDQAGQRIRVPSTQNVDLSLDFGGVTTAVTTPGNSKVVSLFLKFKRALSDPRIDGNSDTVYFVRDESFEFYVKQGTEAATGAEVAPGLESDKLLIADIKRTQGVTTILTAAIQPYATNRRQDVFVVAGTPYNLRAGTVNDAVEDILTIANDVAADIGTVAAAVATEAATRAAADTVTNGFRIRERSTIYVLGPVVGAGHFPITLTADMNLLNLRGNETAELSGDIILPNAALCVGRKFFLYTTNGNNCTLKCAGSAVFLNDGSLAGSYGVIGGDDTEYVMSNGDDRQYEWFTPDGVNWLVTSHDGTPTPGL